MSELDFSVVCAEVDKNSKLLNAISRDLWENPELGLEEVYAHDRLTSAIEQCGFSVQRHYALPTAFKAEYSSQTVNGSGSTVAILLEYDALPDIGHACGHNLIAEAGVAAGMAVKAAMEMDDTLTGKVVLVGTPAEENRGGKIKLLNAKAFDGIDAALMVHPSKFTSAFPPILSCLALNVDFHGKESHAAAFPWEGCNALDAAVACYQSLALLRQQIKPSCRIHAIITNGGKKTNIIPPHSSMEIRFRAASKGEVKKLETRILNCIKCSAESASCTAVVRNNEETKYESIIANRVMGRLFEDYAKQLGLEPEDSNHLCDLPAGSTDMGNVSRVLPAIHPFYNIDTQAFNHTTEFNAEAGSTKAQGPTLKAAKAMAMTALTLMRCPEVWAQVKEEFQSDLSKDLQ